MRQQLMNTLMDRFKDGGGVSERKIIEHGSSIASVKAVFSDNCFVTVSETLIGGAKYVVGSIKVPSKPIERIEDNLFNIGRDCFLEENTVKHEAGE